MKKLIALCFAVTICITAMAQPQITLVEYQKVNRQAVVADMPFPEKTVSKALTDKLERMGHNGKETKGFTAYKGVHIKELGEGSYDLYFMVDRKSKKDKENTTVTMMISKGYDNFLTESEDATVFNNAKTYLNDLRDVVAAYDLEQQIEEQEKTVKSSEKKAADLTEDNTDLEKKKKKIEEQIQDNIKAQATQKTEIEKQKQILDTLKGKRKV